jgi:hypothetical protein
MAHTAAAISSAGSGQGWGRIDMMGTDPPGRNRAGSTSVTIVPQTPQADPTGPRNARSETIHEFASGVYVGDKLAVLTRAVRWLTPAGRFVADLDLASIRLADGRPAGRRLTAQLRAAGLGYDARRHRISCTGPRELHLPYTYLGADDHAGANYTGQPAVHSQYQLP